MSPNSSEAIVSINLNQMLTIIECVVLNIIDGLINAGMSDMLRSPPTPVDKNVSIKVVVYCVVRHDYLSGLVDSITLLRGKECVIVFM